MAQGPQQGSGIAALDLVGFDHSFSCNTLNAT